MAFRHGAYTSEVPTSIAAPAQVSAGIPVVFGTAPVHQTANPSVNKPELCYSFEEAVKKFGYHSYWPHWTLCEFMYCYFALYGNSPCILVNVFDPAKHREEVIDTAEYAPRADNTVNLGPSVIESWFGGRDAHHYYDEDGNCIVTAVTSPIRFEKLVKAAPGNVTNFDIIGGIKADGTKTGLEVIEDIFPTFGIVPGIIAAPRWSENLNSIITAKTENINGLFSCIAVSDMYHGTDRSYGAPVYSDAPATKNKTSMTDPRNIVCWPNVTLGGKTYHMSSHIVSILAKTDRLHDDVPYKSPSNEPMQADGLTLGFGGTEVTMTPSQANYLNSQGIMTALNWVGGWRAWGNRTGAYPSNTDVKDCFIPVRRMMDWIRNTFILTFWQKVDEPMNPRLIRSVVNSFNMYLNSLVAREMLLGARVEFREDENAKTDLLNGILRFHVFLTPPVPAEVIEGIFEYDPEYLTTLYDALK